jgi:L-lysine 2,3-aminomutase
MFVERNTGARRYFEVPLQRTYEIYAAASRSVSGLCKTARGPVMSTSSGKVEILGVVEIGGARLFALRLLQARNSEECFKPFFARYDPSATWFDQLVLA